MIVRILGEAQYDIPDKERATLGSLDSAVTKAVDNGDSDSFAALAAHLGRAVGWGPPGGRRLRSLRPCSALPGRHARGNEGTAGRYGKRLGYRRTLRSIP